MMAGNSKTKARKLANDEKRRNWMLKFRRDIKKIHDTGETMPHYVGGGQAFTKGK